MCGTVALLFARALLFFFKQKTAYEMRISDWSSDVCSSDLGLVFGRVLPHEGCAHGNVHAAVRHSQNGGLVGARYRTAHRQQDHPPHGQLRRPGRPEVRPARQTQIIYRYQETLCPRLFPISARRPTRYWSTLSIMCSITRSKASWPMKPPATA